MNLPLEAWRSAKLLRAIPNCRLVLMAAHHLMSPAQVMSCLPCHGSRNHGCQSRGDDFLAKNRGEKRPQRWIRSSEVGGSRSCCGPLNRLKATLSLPQPLDRYSNPSAIGRSRPISHPHAGRSSQPPHSKPLRGFNHAMAVL